MLTTYTKQDDIPEGLREHYKLIDGKFVPEISDDHPVKINNAKLLTEKDTAQAQVTNLKTEVETAKAEAQSARSSSGLPRGHIAVHKGEYEALIDAVTGQGTATDIKAKLNEYKTLKEESDARARQDKLREVAKELGYDNVDAFIRLPNLPEFEVREKDGKKTVIAKVKEGSSIVEKPAQEFIESSPDIAPFLPALKTKSGVYAPEQRRDDGKPAGNQYDKIREEAKKRAEAQDTSIPLNQRKGLRVIGEKAA